MAADRRPLDATDERLLGLLREDARRTAAALAEQLGVSAASVRRRLARLEQGVIAGYTVVLDHDRVGPSVQAYVELDFSADTDVSRFLAEAVKRPQVREASTLAGHPDAILRVRVGSNDDLRELVTELRKDHRHGRVTGSKILVALGRQRHQPGRGG
ncbi:MAG TPA: Lrp/AsnC family transcriptional regulator [Solirubrobacteraceae bacterium]|nr:Lrp/AsnC family transcriptional regulator [Solirubrobacteraceae bacterium]